MNARAVSAIVVLLVCAGCALPTPLPSPTSESRVSESSIVACAMCEDLAPRSGAKLVVPYIMYKYPEQGIAGLDLQHPGDGNWIIEDGTTGSSRVGPVTITNTVTGFRWKGQVTEYQAAPSGNCCNGLWYQKVVETSVELPVPGVHTGTRVSTPQCEIFQPFGDKGWIYDIEIGDDGGVWIATSDGSARLGPKDNTWRGFGPPDGLPAGSYRFVTTDANGTAWLGAHGGPLYYFDGKHWDRFAGSAQFKLDQVDAVSIAPDQSVWFATRDGVYRWDREADAWRHYTEADGPYTSSIGDILFTPDGKVWLAGREGVSYLDQAALSGGSHAVWTQKQPPTYDFDVATTSRDGRVWFGGHRYFDSSSQSWANTVYLYRTPANDIAVDSRGGLWIATSDGAIYFPDPDNSPGEEWQIYSTDRLGSKGNGIRSLAIAKDGSVWFGADDGTVSGCIFQQ